MRKILLALALLLSAAACGSNPTAAISAGGAQPSLDGGEYEQPLDCTRYALAGGHRTCE